MKAATMTAAYQIGSCRPPRARHAYGGDIAAQVRHRLPAGEPELDAVVDQAGREGGYEAVDADLGHDEADEEARSPR